MATRSLGLALVAGAARAQQEFSHGNGYNHGNGHYYYSNSGLWLFWLFIIVFLLIFLFGCVGGVYSWGGHTHQVHIGRIVERDAAGRVVRTERIEDTTTTVVDDDQYYTGAHHHGYYGAYNPAVYAAVAQRDAPPQQQQQAPPQYAQGSTYAPAPSPYGNISVRREGDRVVQMASKELPGGRLPVQGSSARGFERPLGDQTRKLVLDF